MTSYTNCFKLNFGHFLFIGNMYKIFVLLAIFVTRSNCENESSLKIGSFNMQIFGVTKISKPDVVDVLVKVSSFYLFLFFRETEITL